MPEFRPSNYMLIPSMACQAHCRYCFARKSGEVMSRETAEQVIRFIERTAPSGQDIHLTFHGGEPLLAGEDFYAWILPLLKERFGRRMHLSVQSNLWAMTDSLAEHFRKYEVSVGTSLDGPEDMCSCQRGEGYYARTSAGIGILEKHGLRTGVICTFAAGSESRAEEVYRQSSRPYAIHGAVPDFSRYCSLSLTSSGMEQVLLDSYAAYKADPAHSRITTLDAMARGCLTGEGQLCTFYDCLGDFAAIAPDGGIYPCQRFCGIPAYCLGNVRDGLTEKDILSSPVWIRLRAAQDAKRASCGDCTHLEYCNGGCLYNALTTGSPRDPFCAAYCTLFDRINRDMALEMGAVMLHRGTPTPVLSMAGDRPHPYDLRLSRSRLALAVDKGRGPAVFAAEKLRDPYPENRLNKLYLHITFSCPLRCAHCYAEGGEHPSDELPPARLAGIVREAADRRFRAVVITGGEPLAYSGFAGLCGLLRQTDLKGTKLILRTSLGFPVSDELLKEIFRTFHEIVVSVDGNRETHDAHRGAGRYDITAANLRRAAALGFSAKLRLAATISLAEADGAPGDSVRALAGELGLNTEHIRFRPVLPLGRGRNTTSDPGLLPEDAHFGARFYPRHTCGLGENLYVEPDGSAYPCYAWCSPDKKLGDLGRESLGELLDRGELYEYCRHDVDTNEKCRSCEVRYLCGGICKAWVRDRMNVDSGDFDCSDRKEHFTRLAAAAQSAAARSPKR